MREARDWNDGNKPRARVGSDGKEKQRSQGKHSRRRKKHSTGSRVSPYTSFMLCPPPVCFTTEQSTIKAFLLVNFHTRCPTVLGTFFLLSTPSMIKFCNTIRELKTSSDGWVNDNHNKPNNSFNLSFFCCCCFNSRSLRPDFFRGLGWWCLEIGGVALQPLFPGGKRFI